MFDPATLGVIIPGLVSAYKAYADYKAATVKAESEQKSAPTKSPEVVQGEQAAPLVKQAVQELGTEKDVRVIQAFDDDPDLYQEAFIKMMTRLAEQNPAFATKLQALAHQLSPQTNTVMGAVNNTGSIQGPAVGVNTGSITYNAGSQEK
jgi:hypothetical protein